jgi:dTDP-4-amino-4,6-dideoxygalactose transaminase
MAVPLLDVNAQNHPLADELTAAFQQVLGHGRFIMGPEIERFEAQIADFLGVKHAIGVSSGTDALLLAFMALDLGPGDEVLCPAYTFFATAGTIARTGATPVFVDVHADSFNLDIEAARKKITPRTRAIVPVHLFGQFADLDGVNTLATEHGLRVVEDGAQSMGAAQNGRLFGERSDFATYSYFPSKNLGGLGDSGLVATNDDALANRARDLRVHGMNPKYYHHAIGGNFRMDTLQAALLSVKFAHYAAYTAARQANAAYYSGHLGRLPGVTDGERLILPAAQPGNTHIWNQYTLRVTGEGRRDALRQWLIERQIGCEIYYPLTMDQQPCFQNLPAASLSDCPVAHSLAGEAISIPVFPELSREQADEVIAAIAGFLAAGE